jgi:hypothetical protein
MLIPGWSSAQEEVLRKAAADQLANTASLEALLAQEEQSRLRATAVQQRVLGPRVRVRSANIAAKGDPPLEATSLAFIECDATPDAYRAQSSHAAACSARGVVVTGDKLLRPRTVRFPSVAESHVLALGVPRPMRLYGDPARLMRSDACPAGGPLPDTEGKLPGPGGAAGSSGLSLEARPGGVATNSSHFSSEPAAPAAVLPPGPSGLGMLANGTGHNGQPHAAAAAAHRAPAPIVSLSSGRGKVALHASTDQRSLMDVFAAVSSRTVLPVACATNGQQPHQTAGSAAGHLAAPAPRRSSQSAPTAARAAAATALVPPSKGCTSAIPAQHPGAQGAQCWIEQGSWGLPLGEDMRMDLHGGMADGLHSMAAHNGRTTRLRQSQPPPINPIGAPGRTAMNGAEIHARPP